MTLQELHQLAALGEGAYLEFKHRVPRPERIAKELIAFANTNGGRILIGVGDDGAIVGVDDAAEEEFALHQAMRSYSEPPVTFSVERVVVAPRRDVLVVHVPESAHKPHRLVASAGKAAPNGTAGAYVRVEEMSVEASLESVELMAGEPDAGTTVQFGEKESLLMRYLNDYGRITVQQFAQLANISAPQASETLIRMTRADVLQLHAARGEDYFTLAY